jgi:hypothetical protein
MSKRETKRSERDIRAVRVFVALGLAIALFFIIAGGWLLNSQNRDMNGNTAHLRTPTPTTGSR